MKRKTFFSKLKQLHGEIRKTPEYAELTRICKFWQDCDLLDIDMNKFSRFFLLDGAEFNKDILETILKNCDLTFTGLTISEASKMSFCFFK